MAYVPADARWYLADVVVLISVGDHKENVVHLNTLLVRADSPEEAFERAVELGRNHRMQYKNLAGERVRLSFLGLRDLTVICDGLEHGAELSFNERRVRSLAAARKLVRSKRELSVFAPVRRRGPDYASAHVMKELDAWLAKRERRLNNGRSGPRPKKKENGKAR